MEEKRDTVVVTPSGRLTTEGEAEALLEGVEVVDADSADAIPVTYDDVSGDEIDPEMLDRYYKMAQQQAKMMAMSKRFVPKSVHTKKHQDKAKRNSRNKMAKKSRKANRKK